MSITVTTPAPVVYGIEVRGSEGWVEVAQQAGRCFAEMAESTYRRAGHYVRLVNLNTGKLA